MRPVGQPFERQKDQIENEAEDDQTVDVSVGIEDPIPKSIRLRQLRISRHHPRLQRLRLSQNLTRVKARVKADVANLAPTRYIGESIPDAAVPRRTSPRSLPPIAGGLLEGRDIWVAEHVLDRGSAFARRVNQRTDGAGQHQNIPEVKQDIPCSFIRQNARPALHWKEDEISSDDDGEDGIAVEVNRSRLNHDLLRLCDELRKVVPERRVIGDKWNGDKGGTFFLCRARDENERFDRRSTCISRGSSKEDIGQPPCPAGQTAGEEQGVEEVSGAGAVDCAGWVEAQGLLGDEQGGPGVHRGPWSICASREVGIGSPMGPGHRPK